MIRIRSLNGLIRGAEVISRPHTILYYLVEKSLGIGTSLFGASIFQTEVVSNTRRISAALLYAFAFDVIGEN